MVGYVQFYNFTESSVEVGWKIHPKFFGRGYGSKSVEVTLMEIAHRFPSLQKISLSVKKSNVEDSLHLSQIWICRSILF